MTCFMLLPKSEHYKSNDCQKDDDDDDDSHDKTRRDPIDGLGFRIKSLVPGFGNATLNAFTTRALVQAQATGTKKLHKYVSLEVTTPRGGRCIDRESSINGAFEAHLASESVDCSC